LPKTNQTVNCYAIIVAVMARMLDQTFSALSDPTRRAIVARLASGEGLTVKTLAAPFPVSLPAVIKHLDVLCAAGLVTRERTGRTVTCRLSAEPMNEAMAWLDRHVRFWEARLDALATLVEAKPANDASRRKTMEQTSDDNQQRAPRRRRQKPG
jgi:DNA-binding transcriptional ArsR family regulator